MGASGVKKWSPADGTSVPGMGEAPAGLGARIAAATGAGPERTVRSGGLVGPSEDAAARRARALTMWARDLRRVARAVHMGCHRLVDEGVPVETGLLVEACGLMSSGRQMGNPVNDRFVRLVFAAGGLSERVRSRGGWLEQTARVEIEDLLALSEAWLS